MTNWGDAATWVGAAATTIAAVVPLHLWRRDRADRKAAEEETRTLREAERERLADAAKDAKWLQARRVHAWKTFDVAKTSNIIWLVNSSEEPATQLEVTLEFGDLPIKPDDREAMQRQDPKMRQLVLRMPLLPPTGSHPMRFVAGDEPLIVTGFPDDEHAQWDSYFKSDLILRSIKFYDSADVPWLRTFDVDGKSALKPA